MLCVNDTELAFDMMWCMAKQVVGIIVPVIPGAWIQAWDHITELWRTQASTADRLTVLYDRPENCWSVNQIFC